MKNLKDRFTKIIKRLKTNTLNTYTVPRYDLEFLTFKVD